MAIGHTLLGNGAEGVIVCHGWFGDCASTYGPMMPWLDIERISWAFLDQRGYGKSKEMAGPFTVEQIAADAIDLADALGWDRFHIIGHSMGGKVVQRVALDATARVKSAIAVTPVPASGVPFPDEVWAMFAGAPDDDEKRAAIANHSVSGRLPARWTEEVVRASHETATVEAYREYLPSWAKGDFSAEAAGLATPIKIVVGEFDEALNPDFMRATFLEWYPNAEMEVIGNAGHYPMQETPVYLAGVLAAFILKNS
jgi:pimeloyl-ACP methyl ester carboxylesterase